ncbi:type II secretion system protein J [Bdellovibrio sp. HCB337]|uniref:PulJ/GspJ family protein n=1 Tax=Bdellovibrio sp. HCB337 TaxID=3394358 RepID=UPI0039A5CA66
MKQNKGYTIVELMMAMGLSFLVISSTVGILVYFFSEKHRLDVWSAGQLEMSTAIKMIESDIRNIVRLELSEDLRGANDSLYFGLTSVPPGEEPAICANNATSSVIRYTSLNRIVRQETLMRSWSEENSVDQAGPAHELRVSEDGTQLSLFSTNNIPAEIVLVDADRRYTRRYQVASRVFHLNMNLDPYDDLPKTDALGNPILFNYASVFLRRPRGITNNPTTAKPAVFVTGSDVYASNTVFICLRRTDNSVIKHNPVTNQTMVILENNSKDFSLRSFVVSYLNTKKGTRVDPTIFFPSVLASPDGNCVNAVHVNIQAELTQAQDGTTQNKEINTDIIRRRTIFAHNLSVKRPASCNQ